MSNRLGLQFLVTLLLVVIAQAAQAHKIRPAIVDAQFSEDGTYHLSIKTNIEALVARIGPEHQETSDSPQAVQYDALRALSPSRLQTRFAPFAPEWLNSVIVEFDGQRGALKIDKITIPPVGDVALARLSVVSLSGRIPAGAKAFRIGSGNNRTAILRVKRAGQDGLVTALLKDGAKSPVIALQGVVKSSLWRTFVDYTGLGFEHIVPKGLDHILFVLGLYLLNTSLRPLLIQITAFTLAHSITLGLGLYGIVTISPAIVEPLIAASIVYVAVENIVTSKLHFWRPVIVFMFGLLHGLGFASVLSEIGLPRADYVSGLIAFNVGIELGQLSVIAIAFLLTGLWFRHKSWYRSRIVIPASLAIAVVGAYWAVERLFF